MNKDFIFRVTSILIAVFALISCDDDFNSVGSEVIGGVGFEEDTYISTPIAYNKKLERVQTSGLSGNLLGFYNDPVYGNTSYNILSQILPATFGDNLTFEENTVIDNVVLSIPYFSTGTSVTNADNTVTNTYVLDSVYGNQPIKLSIYHSNYFLRNFDPNAEGDNGEFTNRQLYYSDDIQNFGNAIEAELLGEIESFVPSKDEVVTLGLDGSDDNDDLDTLKVSPRLLVDLSKDFFKKWIIDQQGQPELSNSNNFLNYLRGIYFKTEPVNMGQGTLFAFDIQDAEITMRYGLKDSIPNKELKFNFSNNIVNGITNNFAISIPDPDTDKGDESLYLKGGEGSYAVLELFSRYVETDDNGEYILDENGNPLYKATPANLTANDKTELDFLRDQNWLVNNASLKLYVDREKMTVGGSTEPERVYIFNLESGEVLADFCQDPTTSFISDPNNAVTIHLGRLNRGSDGIGEFYQINLTRHIINLLDNNIDVTKLGISVSQNVTIEGQVVNNNCLSSPSLSANDDDIVPISSVLSPEGTIIYGSTDNVASEKRLQLEIKYSKSIRN